jgi:hypothetical protein
VTQAMPRVAAAAMMNMVRYCMGFPFSEIPQPHTRFARDVSQKPTKVSLWFLDLNQIEAEIAPRDRWTINPVRVRYEPQQKFLSRSSS